MHIDIVPNGGSPPAILLRESYRENGKTKKRTLANLSDWPAEQIDQLRAVLRGERLLPASDAIEIIRPRHRRSDRFGWPAAPARAGAKATLALALIIRPVARSRGEACHRTHARCHHRLSFVGRGAGAWLGQRQ